MKPAEPKGFHPAHRLLDLANLTRRVPGADREAVAAVLAEHGESAVDLATLTDADADELCELAQRFGDLLTETDVDTCAIALNALLDEHTSRPRLSQHDGHTWHLHVQRSETWSSWLAASGALALAQLLSERGRLAWGECAAPGCRNLFLDDGPGSVRRFCSTACGNRARVTEHRARKREHRA